MGAGLLRRLAGLSGLSLAGQATYLLALPLVSRMYAPSALGLFTLYLSVVNIAGAVVGGKFEAALYGEIDRAERRLGLTLALVTGAVMALGLSGVVLASTWWLPHEFGATVRTLLPILPLGFALSGAWAATTAWAVAEGALRPLAWARFAQPAALAGLQLLAGAGGLPAIALILAHVASHLVFSGVILSATLSRRDWTALLVPPWRDLLRRAVRDRRFPLYAVPAVLVLSLIGNAPPLLMGAIFGTDFAGQYGVAYRVVTGPLSVLCQPLGHIFLSEASRTGPERTRVVAVFALAVSVVCVALPVLVFGLAAPTLCRALLGPAWGQAGAIIAALAALGAAQAVAAPFVEVPALIRRPELRLSFDLLQGGLFFLPLGLGLARGWDPLSTIWLMAAGGASGALVTAALTLRWLFQATGGSTGDRARVPEPTEAIAAVSSRAA